MSITITFTGATPEAIEDQLAEWTKVLREGRRTVEAADKLNARVAEVQANVARAVKEEAQRAEAHASNVKALKEMAAQLKEQEAPPLDPAPSAEAVQAVVSAEDTLLSSGPENSSSVSSVEPALLGGADVPPYDEVMVAVLDVANAYSKDEALAMLSKFGAKRASDIDPSRWADVIAAAQALLKAA
jgi:hypothetical protein